MSFYLRCISMGSVLDFYKVVKNHGAYLKLDNGETVAFRNGKYFQCCKDWETTYFERFETKEDCISWVNKNYEEYIDWSHPFNDKEDCLSQFHGKQHMEESK